MTPLIIISLLLRLGLTGYITYELIRYADMLNIGERIGLGLAGGSAFLTLAVISDVNKEGTPFDVWAGMLFSLGFVIYLASRQIRLQRHEKANEQMIRQAREHFAKKG